MGIIEQVAEIKVQKSMIKRMLIAKEFEIEKIAALAGVSVAFVKEVKQELRKEAVQG